MPIKFTNKLQESSSLLVPLPNGQLVYSKTRWPTEVVKADFDAFVDEENFSFTFKDAILIFGPFVYVLLCHLYLN